jgi:hypothetical protein
MRSGFTHSYISKIEGGYQGVESRSLRAISDALMVSYEWLLGSEHQPGPHAHDLKAEVLNPVEYRAIKLLREMDPEHRLLLLAALEGINAHLSGVKQEEGGGPSVLDGGKRRIAAAVRQQSR